MKTQGEEEEEFDLLTTDVNLLGISFIKVLQQIVTHSLEETSPVLEDSDPFMQSVLSSFFPQAKEAATELYNFLLSENLTHVK